MRRNARAGCLLAQPPRLVGRKAFLAAGVAHGRGPARRVDDPPRVGLSTGRPLEERKPTVGTTAPSISNGTAAGRGIVHGGAEARSAGKSLKNGAQRSDLDELSSLWLWPRNRCSTSRRDQAERVGASSTGSAAKFRDRNRQIAAIRALSAQLQANLRLMELRPGHGLSPGVGIL